MARITIADLPDTGHTAVASTEDVQGFNFGAGFAGFTLASASTKTAGVGSSRDPICATCGYEHYRGGWHRVPPPPKYW